MNDQLNQEFFSKSQIDLAFLRGIYRGLATSRHLFMSNQGADKVVPMLNAMLVDLEGEILLNSDDQFSASC